MNRLNNQKRKIKVIGLGNSGLSSLNGCACQLGGLGRISPALENLVKTKKDNLDEIIDQIESNAGISEMETFSFEEIDLLYNKGISTDEKKAWVYYKRKKGTPMTGGWKKYYIDLEDQIEVDRLVLAGDLFYLNGSYVPYPVFAWGNMYDRLKDTENAKDYIISHYTSGIYENHIEVIKSHIPRAFRVDDDEEAMRPTILPISSIARNFMITEVRPEFADIGEAQMIDKMGRRVTKKKRVEFSIDGENPIPLIDAYKKWLHTIDKRRNFKENVHPNDIINYYLDGFPISGPDKDKSNSEQAEIKANARDEGNRLFNKFMLEVLTEEDIERLNTYFNQKYNGWSDLNYSRIPIGMEISSTFLGGGFAIRPEKREAIAYMEAVGSGILAYDVGVGKTVSALLELASAMQQGKAKRPLVVVPNPTYSNWLKEAFGGTDDKTGEAFNGILSGLGIKVNEWFNMGSSIEKKLGNQLDKQVEENTITFITYEGFQKLGFSQNVSNDFVNELTEAILDDVEDPEFANDEGGLGTLGRSERDETKKLEKINEIVGRGQVQSVADVDTLGFDYIVIDEAHRAKNIFEGVSKDKDTGNKVYALQGSSSTTGIKAFFICNYIQRTFGGNVMLLTATPFTNSPLEIYAMMSLVGLDLLKENGYFNLNDFFKNFVKPKSEFVVKQNGDVVMKEVIKGFENILILQKLIFTKINYKTGEDVGVKRPCKVNLPLFSTSDAKGNKTRLEPKDQKLTYLQMTEAQKDIQLSIISGFNSVKGFKDRGILMRYFAESLNNAFSPYLVGHSPKSPLRNVLEAPTSAKQFVNNSPKIKYAVDCIATIKKHHDSRNEEMSGQVIYSNRGIRFFPFIQKYLLEEVGFKKTVTFKGKKISEVMILAGGKEASRIPGVPPGEIKEFIKDAFQSGVIKVLIGSSTIREGINLQKRGTTIFNLYPDWNPTDVRQLEGRIWRQGNKFGFVRMALPLMADSMDVFVFQKLEEKTSRINDIFFREGKSNVLDLDDIDPGEIKYALISDVNQLAKIDFSIEQTQAFNSLNILKEDAESVKQLDRELQLLDQAKRDAIDQLTDAKRILQFYMDNNPRGVASTDEKKVFDKAKRLIIKIEEYEASPKNEELAKFQMKLANWPFSQWSTYGINKYRIDAFSRVYKAVIMKERQILKPKGFSLSDNFEEVSKNILEEFEEKEKVYNQAYGNWVDANLNDRIRDASQRGEKSETNPEGVIIPERWKAIIEDIMEKKQKLRVNGEKVGVRVKEFASLNYLLTYGIKDVDLNACPLPSGPNNRKPVASNSSKERAKQKMKIKAKAVLILMGMNGLGGGNTTVNINSDISREDYPGLFEDYDNDGVLNADDPNPLKPGDDGTIEEVLLSDEIGKLIDLRNRLEKIKKNLVNKVSDIGNGEVLARSKTPISIINKLIRKRLFGRNGLTDLVGSMLVVEDEKALKKALKEIKSGKLGKVIEHEDFYKNPLDGYRAHHFIVEVDDLPVELQLKTARMKAISGAAHTPYKNGKLNAGAMLELTSLAMKADQGDRMSIEKIDNALKNKSKLTKRLTL